MSSENVKKNMKNISRKYYENIPRKQHNSKFRENDMLFNVTAPNFKYLTSVHALVSVLLALRAASLDPSSRKARMW